MKLLHTEDNEDMLFAILYLNFPIEIVFVDVRNSTSTFKLILSTGEIYDGQEKILKKLCDLCMCEPHDFNLLNEEVIKEIKNIKKTAPKVVLKEIVNGHNKKRSSLSIIEEKAIPSNISDVPHLNGKNMTLADLYLFSKLYIQYKRGDKFNEDECNYLKNFQNGLLHKHVPIKDLFQPDFDNINIQVGKIIEVQNHPNADKLYCEKVLIDEENNKIITVVSGIKEHVDIDSLINKKFLFVTNLKPNKLRGVLSEGMILCCKDNEGGLEVLSVPEDVKVGTVLEISNVSDEQIFYPRVKTPKDLLFNAKDARFEKAMKELKVMNHKLMFSSELLTASEQEIETKIKDGYVS